MQMSNYPAGAELDPKAPYNQNDYDEDEIGISEDEYQARLDMMQEEALERMMEERMEWSRG